MHFVAYKFDVNCQREIKFRILHYFKPFFALHWSDLLALVKSEVHSP